MTLAHPRLAHAILALRPGLKPGIDFICFDDGSGPRLQEGSMANPPSQAEVNALTTAQLDAAQADKAADKVDSMDVIIGKVLFNHENRIRALEGRAPITAQQFRTAIRALMAQ